MAIGGSVAVQFGVTGVYAMFSCKAICLVSYSFQLLSIEIGVSDSSLYK